MTSPTPNYPPDSLTRFLERTPEEVYSWVEGGQLRLVAATFADLTAASRTRSPEHKVADFRREIDARVLQKIEPPVKWDNWWEKVRPWIGYEGSAYFSKGEQRDTYRLKPGVAPWQIDVEPLKGKPKTAGTGASTGSSSSSPARKSATKSSAGRDLPEWVRWLWATDDTPLPGITPPDGLAVLLETCPEEIIERVMARLMSGVEEALSAPRLTPKAKDQWLELVTKAHRRRQEVPGQESTGATARRTPKVLAQLTDALEQQARIQPLLSQIGTLVNSDPHRRQEFARGVWDTFQSDRPTAETMLKRLAATLDDKQQVTLWGDVLTAAFVAPSYPNRITDVNRVTGWLKADQQAAAIRRLILQTALGNANGVEVANFVAESRYAGKSSGPEKLNSLVTAGLLLSAREDSIIPEAARAYRLAVEQPGTEMGNALISGILKASRDSTQEAKKPIEVELGRERQLREEDIKQWAKEKEHLQSQIDTLAADKAARREMSRIEITQDMLLRVGDAIQRIYQMEETPEECHTQLKRILPFALQDGGAELLGTVGDIVPYEARLHHTTERVDEGSPVRLSAPGVIVTGGLFEDKVILKANAAPV